MTKESGIGAPNAKGMFRRFGVPYQTIAGSVLAVSSQLVKRMVAGIDRKLERMARNRREKVTHR
jgi:hypothetical protein